MKTKITLFISILLFSTHTFSQQIGDGRATEITDFSIPLKSGVYQGVLPSGRNPDTQFHAWQHLFVIRHSNDANNHQLQLSSSYAMNDRLFFRKLATGSGSTNPTWIELATRGANVFIGNQTVNGNQTVDGTQIISGNLFIGKDTQTTMISGPANSGAIQIKSNGAVGGSQNRFLRLGWKDNNSYFTPVLTINDGLNVGIGSTNPDEKLTVNGTIHATEVKVTADVPADYVFEKYYLGQSSLKPDYTMLTLAEVQKFTEENHHLPNVPSAKEIKENGLHLGEMSNILLQKIEELTLYSIDQQKTIERQAAAIGNLEKQNESFKKLEERLAAIEKGLDTEK